MCSIHIQNILAKASNNNNKRDSIMTTDKSKPIVDMPQDEFDDTFARLEAQLAAEMTEADVKAMKLTAAVQQTILEHTSSWSDDPANGDILLASLGGAMASVIHEIFDPESRVNAHIAFTGRMKLVAGWIENPDEDALIQFDEQK